MEKCRCLQLDGTGGLESLKHLIRVKEDAGPSPALKYSIFFDLIWGQFCKPQHLIAAQCDAQYWVNEKHCFRKMIHRTRSLFQIRIGTDEADEVILHTDDAQQSGMGLWHRSPSRETEDLPDISRREAQQMGADLEKQDFQDISRSIDVAFAVGQRRSPPQENLLQYIVIHQ